MMETAFAALGGARWKTETVANNQLIPAHTGHQLLPPTYDRPKHLLCLAFAFVRSTHETCHPGCPLQETIIGGR
jgi:hypothetical protein